MSEDYTPTTGDVRNYYAGWVDERSSDSVEEAYAEFDRWLAQYTQEVREQVAREIEEAGRKDVSAWTNPDVRFGAKDAYETAARIAGGGAS